MERTTQQILSDITKVGTITGTDVIMEYVNKQNADCDESSMSSATGKLEKVTEEGVKVFNVFSPFAGPLAAICSIKRVGNNRLVYKNPNAYQAYTKNPLPLSKEQMESVREQGRWFIK